MSILEDADKVIFKKRRRLAVLQRKEENIKVG